MNRTVWPLHALAAAREGRLSPVQIQKALFLIGQELKPSRKYYDFRPYHYGPFDIEVYEDLEVLSRSGLVKRVKSSAHAGTDYQITDSGKLYIQEETLPGNEQSYIHSLVAWVQSRTFSQLVSAIYRKYPQYRAKSIFRG